VIKSTNPNQIFDYTRRITPKRVTSYGAHLRVIAARQQSYFCRCWSGGEPFATLCKICMAFRIRTLDLPHTRHTR